MADLDLTEFLKEGSLNDLGWLAVDEEEYRREGVLPKQNLDVVPDLTALWTHVEDGVQMGGHREPVTMLSVGLSGGVGRVDNATEITRFVRLAMMARPTLERVLAATTAKFDRESLVASQDAIKASLEEFGLLGRYYIDSSDFPGCHRASTKVLSFVRKHSARAPFVKAKPDCQGCKYASDSLCGMFQKKLVIDVPYTPALARKVEDMQAGRGRDVQKTASATPRERIRAALLAPATRHLPVLQSQPQANPTNLHLLSRVAEVQPVVVTNPAPALPSAWSGLNETEAAVTASQRTAGPAFVGDYMDGSAPAVAPAYSGPGALPAKAADARVAEEGMARAASEAARARTRMAELVAARSAPPDHPVVAFLRREMLKGRTDLVSSMRLAFGDKYLRANRDTWLPVLKEAGLYGVLYSTQDSFRECREGADFLARHASPVKAIVRGSKCEGCIYSKLSRCLMYGRKLVEGAQNIVNWESATQVASDHVAAGRLASVDAHTWGSDPISALRAMHAALASGKAAPVVAGGRMEPIVTAFRGTNATTTLPGIRDKVVTAAAQFMNEGLYGRDLVTALRSRFDPRDIESAREPMRRLLAEQGLQGIYYVDPSVYDDYGHGCDEAARLHATRKPIYAKIGPKCATCVHQAVPGKCSKLHKALVVEPPYTDKAEQQRAVLASGASTEIRYQDIVNNGHSMVLEYEMGARPLVADVDEAPADAPLEITFGGQGIKL